MKLYHGTGHAYLVCPRLLELDKRHGDHSSKWPLCRRQKVCRKDHEHRNCADDCELDHEHYSCGALCLEAHDHEAMLRDPEGHRVVDFYWLPSCRPPSADEHPLCVCGRRLVLTDLDDLYADEHLIEVDDPAGFDAALAAFRAGA